MHLGIDPDKIKDVLTKNARELLKPLQNLQNQLSPFEISIKILY